MKSKRKIVFILLFLIVAASIADHSNRHKNKKKHEFKDRVRKLKKSKTSRADDSDLLVQTENGLVRGIQLNENLFAWRGIPYAKPPLNELRFEPPQRPGNWTGIWNATEDKSECVQTDITNLMQLIFPPGSEDCLYINVYAPQTPKLDGTLLPVMAWIYGGGFIVGASNYTLYGPDDICKQDVVFVSFNYRLGIFGFLSTEDDAAPGNTGLKDQVFALKWIQRNIAAFGGDPSKVTIFGESAGAFSVSFLVTSQATRGLFRAAIMESGVSLSPAATSKTARKAAFAVGNLLGIRTNNSQELVQHLKSVPAQVLQRKSEVVMGWILALDVLNGLVFAPVIEPPNKNAILTVSTYELLSRGIFNRVSVIIGYNSAEVQGIGSTPGSTLSTIIQLYLLQYDLIPSRLVPQDLNVNQTDLNTVGNIIKRFYAGNSSLAFPSDNFNLYASDIEFVKPSLKAVELTSAFSTTWVYRFSFSNNSIGAGHADELNYIFNSNLTTPEQRQVKKNMITWWTNFAKSNNPNLPNNSTGLTWKPLTPNDRDVTYFLNINRTSTVGENPNENVRKFWDDLTEEYGNPPLYPEK